MHTYGVVITVAGHTYSYHVPTKQAVRDLFYGCTAEVTDIRVLEETHQHYTTTFREMSYREIRQILEDTLVAA